MKRKQELAEAPPQGAWTRPDAYFGALARKRSFRRAREDRTRTQPESPRLLLSTVPFLALMALLAVMVIAIAVIAFPGSQPKVAAGHASPKERGVAQRGWFQEAQKQFHK